MDKNAMAVEVRAARKARGLTQAQLSTLAGVSERTVRNIEAGKGIDGKTAADVFRALGYASVPSAWPDDVQAFLDMVGFRLTRLEPQARHDLMQQVTLMVVEFRETA